MKRSIDYLKDAKEKLGISQDTELANTLKTTPQNINNFMKERSLMDDYHCIKVAQVLGIDPMEIIAAAQEEREKNPEKQRFWQDFRTARSKETGQMIVPVMGLIALITMALLIASKGQFNANFDQYRYILC